MVYELQVNSSSGYLLTLASGAGGDADLQCLPGGSLYNAFGPPSATEYAWSSGVLASWFTAFHEQPGCDTHGSMKQAVTSHLVMYCA